MNILWLHQYFATPSGWGAVRTYAFARRFVRAGHAVDVVCGSGYDASLSPTGREPVVVDGMRVFVSGTSYRPHMGFARRVVSFLCFMGGALWFVVRHGRRYDVVIASSGPLTLAVPALVGRWLWRVPFVFEVIDVWPDSAIAAGVLRNAVLKWLSFRLEALAYRYAAAIVTCSTGMTERVEGKLGVRDAHVDPMGQCADTPNHLPRRHSKATTISNCCDVEMFPQDPQTRNQTRAAQRVGADQTVVLYTGAMGRSNAVEDLVAAVNETADDGRIVWWFAGGGPEEGRLRAAVEGRGSEAEVGGKTVRDGAPRVRFFGSLPKAELIGLYLAADLNVVTFMHEPLFYENSPNKFFDGIAAGLPAVFNRTTWLEPWLKEYECGVVCKGARPGRDMAEAIMRLAGDPGLRGKMGRGARRLAEEVFSRDTLAEEYLGVLGDVLKSENSHVRKP